MDVQDLKKLLASQLCDADRLKPPESLPTGLEELDRFLLGGGLPKGSLSLFKGELGTGGTSLWIEAAARLLNGGRWVAWINHDIPLSPLPLAQRSLPLDRFVTVAKPEDESKLFWLLQELMSSSLFDLIGCDLGEGRLKEHHLRKLQAQAREAHVSLVFFSRAGGLYRGSLMTLFSLILHFDRRHLVIERALHRPTPHRLARSISYDRFTLHTTDRITASPVTGSVSTEDVLAPEGERSDPRPTLGNRAGSDSGTSA